MNLEDVSLPTSGYIAVIIVNYGTSELSIAAVQSILRHSHNGRQVEIHLVDNGSPGDDAAQLSAAHASLAWGTQVVLWPETENNGFGCGNNLVIHALAKRSTPPKYVFLLNPDAALDNEAIAILAAKMDVNPTIGACGAGISLPSGQPVTAAFRFPSAWSCFAEAVNFGPVTARFSKHLTALPPDYAEGAVDWVSGAAVMFRLDVLKELMGFDPKFFLYFEEVELMYRVKAVGYQVYYLPQARILHAEGAATQVKSGSRTRKAMPSYWYSSWRYYFTKTKGRRGALVAAIAWVSGALFNTVIAFILRRSFSYPLHFFSDFFSQVILPILYDRKSGTHD